MTIWEMQTRRYLGKVEKQAQIVKHLKDAEKEIKELIYSIGSPGTGEKVQVSPAADRTINKLMELDEKKAELAAACSAYEDFKIKVMDEIHKIPNEVQQEVLYQRYLQFKTLRSISEEMNYSYSHVTRVCQNGIRSFWRLNKDAIEKMQHNAT